MLRGNPLSLFAGGKGFGERLRTAVLCLTLFFLLLFLFFLLLLLTGHFEPALFHEGAHTGKEVLLSEQELQRALFIDCGRVKDGQETASYHLINLRGKRGKPRERPESLTGRNQRVVVGNLLVVRIAALRDALVTAVCQHLLREAADHLNPREPAQILLNFLCDRRREHARIGSRVGDQLFFVEFLRDLKGLIRAYLKAPRAVILQFRQIIKKRRPLDFLLFLVL